MIPLHSRQLPSKDATQNLLLSLAVGFVFFITVSITLSPSARVQSWDVALRWQQWIGFAGWAAGFLLLNRYSRRLLPDADPYLIPITAILSGWGLMMVWRLNPALGMRQTLWLIFGLGLVGFGLRYHIVLEIFRRYKYIWLISGILLTAFTYFFGTYPEGIGPKLWLGCCGVFFQPSELLKLLLVVYLASSLSERLPTSYNLLHLLAPTLVMAGIGLALVIGQQDLGAASLLVIIYILTVYLSSGRFRILIFVLPLLAAAGWLGYQQFSVVRIRLDAWMNPWTDPSGKSFQVVQALMSVAAGGLFGSGAGLGSPGVVPVAHSDFIFSAISEEFGLIGVIVFIALFGLLVSRGFLTAIKAVDSYRRILAASLSMALVIQMVLIAGGNIRLLPITGVTLPLVSYGGSSLVSGFIAITILILISSESEAESAPIASTYPYVITSAALISALFVLSIMSGYWGVIRSAELLARTDNPRRAISDRYARRGSLVDHKNRVISQTIGIPGSLQRQHLYPALSPTIGFSSPVFGQAGLEEAMDPYLRGLQGNSQFQIMWNHLLNGQPPEGRDVRLSLDIDLQQKIDQMISGHKGGAILLNARSGEILVMSSHPHVDPNNLEKDWPEIIKNPNGPLVNRITQSQYSPGSALGPFLLALYQNEFQLPILPDKLSYDRGGLQLRCALPLPAGQTVRWADAIANGCPTASMALGSQVHPNQLQSLFQNLGFYSAPTLPIRVAPARSSETIQQTDLASIGEENLTLSPLQLALAAAAITSNGSLPQPVLTTAVQTTKGGWEVLSTQGSKMGVQPAQAAFIRQMLQVPDRNIWQTLALSQNTNNTVSWFLGGSVSISSEIPLAAVVVLEEDNPQLAEQIGLTLLTFLSTYR